MAIVDNIVSYWKFDESSGNASDSTASAYTLTNNGTITYVAGKINNCGDLESGSSQYYGNTGGGTTGLALTGDFSIGFWVNFESLPSSGNTMWMFDKKSESNEDYSYYAVYLLNTAGTYSIKLRTTNGSATSNIDVGVNWTPSTATWYYVVITRTSSGGSVSFFVNGSQQGSSQTGYNGALTGTSTLAFYYGRYKSGDGRYFDGKVDEAGIWSRVLSGAEITSLYNSGTGLSYPFANSYDETYTETMTLVDTVHKSTTRVIANAMTLVDTFNGIKVFEQLLTEVITLTDTLVRSITRPIVNAITMVDTLGRSMQRSLVDTFTLVDTFDALRVILRTLTETMTLTDNFLVNGTNVIWGHIVKAADAVWTKIIRS